jgi:hypothetical protein
MEEEVLTSYVQVCQKINHIVQQWRIPCNDTVNVLRLSRPTLWPSEAEILKFCICIPPEQTPEH